MRWNSPSHTLKYHCRFVTSNRFRAFGKLTWELAKVWCVVTPTLASAGEVWAGIAPRLCKLLGTVLTVFIGALWAKAGSATGWAAAAVCSVAAVGTNVLAPPTKLGCWGCNEEALLSVSLLLRSPAVTAGCWSGGTAGVACAIETAGWTTAAGTTADGTGGGWCWVVSLDVVVFSLSG